MGITLETYLKRNSLSHITTLTLKSEKLANKVTFTTFIEKIKNYVLTEFDDGKDMMPILEHLTDPKDKVTKKNPLSSLLIKQHPR